MAPPLASSRAIECPACGARVREAQVDEPLWRALADHAERDKGTVLTFERVAPTGGIRRREDEGPQSSGPEDGPRASDLDEVLTGQGPGRRLRSVSALRSGNEIRGLRAISSEVRTVPISPFLQRKPAAAC
jgi:hypothetical protein